VKLFLPATGAAVVFDSPFDVETAGGFGDVFCVALD